MRDDSTIIEWTDTQTNDRPADRPTGLIEDPSGPKVDWGGLQSYVQESSEKVRKGVSFYVQGTKLLASDLQVRALLCGAARACMCACGTDRQTDRQTWRATERRRPHT